MAGITLETERLLLVPFGTDDLEVFHGLNTDAHVRRWLWDDEEISRAMAVELLQKNAVHFAADGYGLWRLETKEAGETAGYAGLWHFFGEGQPQLLYALLEEHTGRGYAVEAAAEVCRYTFDVLGFPHLDASMDVGHRASRRVAERLGMEFVGEKEIEGKPTLLYRLRPNCS